MQVSQRCQYTLRALFELAKHQGKSPVAMPEIANAQAIPSRFLESILADLKNQGTIESRRGNGGGYVLAVPSEKITVGDIIRAVDGSLSPVKCVAGRSDQHCRLKNQCIFQSVWQKAQRAMESVYDQTSLRDLINEERNATLQSENPLVYIV
jgi:Rrf2 family protein